MTRPDINSAIGNDGQPVERVVVNTIAPIAYAAEARKIAADCLNQSPDMQAEASQMLPVLLRPVGSSGSPSHVFCSRACHTHGLQAQLGYFAGVGLPWVSGVRFTIDDDTDTMLGLMATITGYRDAVLAALGLEEVIHADS